MRVIEREHRQIVTSGPETLRAKNFSEGTLPNIWEKPSDRKPQAADNKTGGFYRRFPDRVTILTQDYDAPFAHHDNFPSNHPYRDLTTVFRASTYTKSVEDILTREETPLLTLEQELALVQAGVEEYTRHDRPYLERERSKARLRRQPELIDLLNREGAETTPTEVAPPTLVHSQRTYLSEPVRHKAPKKGLLNRLRSLVTGRQGKH